MKSLEVELHAKEQAAAQRTSVTKGRLKVNGPLPQDFSTIFARGVAEATSCPEDGVRVLGAVPAEEVARNVDEIVYEARSDCISAVEKQAADPASKLANGVLHIFLVAEGDEGAAEDAPPPAASAGAGRGGDDPAPDVDGAMPYGGLEPFGREDTAQELTESSITESDAMVDQLERAEVAEEKRAVFRALTRLRGAAITSYDGIARAQTGNLDEYAQKHKWRAEHPVHHLAHEESDVSRWAFPGNADF